MLRDQGQGRDITAADSNKADSRLRRGAYTIPAGQPVPARRRARRRPRRGPRSTRWASATRSGSRSTRTTSRTSPTTRRTRRRRSAVRGPSGIGRFEIVRKPANYGWPLCYSSDLGYYQWNFHEFAPGTTTRRHAAGQPAAADRLRQPDALRNDSRWNVDGGPASSPACADAPPVTDPDIWYSYRDNNADGAARHAVLRLLRADPGPDRPGLDDRVPAAVPGALHRRRRPARRAKYHYDPANPNTTKFPPYYDDSVILGEFTQDTLREVKLDSQNRVFKINQFLDCGQANIANPAFDVRVRQPDGHAVRARTARSTC